MSGSVFSELKEENTYLQRREIVCEIWGFVDVGSRVLRRVVSKASVNGCSAEETHKIW